MIRIISLTTLLTLSSCGALLQLTDQKSTIREIDSTSIQLSGVLGKQMHKKLESYLENHPEVNKIVLDQIPGSINDEWNVKTCSMIHDRGIETYLNSNSVIASGGVDLFISGAKRTIQAGAKIGVHSWRDGKKDGSEYPREAKEHDLFIDFFNEIEMDTAFYWYTLSAAPGKDIHWMSDEEIGRFQLSK